MVKAVDKNIEKTVLERFTKVNPSFVPADDIEDWKIILDDYTTVLRDRLHILPIFMEGKKLLDLGCGTGEHTCVYAYHGAKVSGIDFNPIAIERAKELFAKRALEENLEDLTVASFSDWSPPSQPYFDIVVSDGVLHHTADARAVFAKIVSVVKPNGLIAISTAGIPGSEQRLLMRRLIQRFTDNLEDAIRLSTKWFPMYMKRAIELGHRTDRQIVNDNFLVEQKLLLDLEDMLRWFHEEGLRLYRTWPPIEPHLTDSPTHIPIDWTAPGYRSILAKVAEQWAYANEDDADRFQRTESHADLAERNARARAEFDQIETLLESGDQSGLDRYLPSCKQFGHGVCGVGKYWIVGTKGPE